MGPEKDNVVNSPNKFVYISLVQAPNLLLESILPRNGWEERERHVGGRSWEGWDGEGKKLFYIYSFVLGKQAKHWL